MTEPQNVNQNKEVHLLVIKSITLLDGKTPDERVQYKVGREVAKVVGGGMGCPFFVFYDEKRGWRTNPVDSIEEDEEKLVLKDNLSIYTFNKVTKPIQ